MNTKSLLTVAALAAAAFSATAQAGEADYSSNLPQFQSQRTRAEVRAEARQAPVLNGEIGGVAIITPAVASQADRQAVRAETVQAVRAGQIAHGELS